MSIWESDVGRSVATTRQKVGTLKAAGWPPRCPPPPAPRSPAAAGAAGGVNVPAGIISVSVMVVLGSETDFKFAQGVAASAVVNSTTARFPIICTSRMRQNYHNFLRFRQFLAPF